MVHLNEHHFTLFLCGDVMTGRGIDQILPYPGDPQLHEQFVRNAMDYVQITELTNGMIDRPVSFQYVWGETLPWLQKIQPDLRFINLETALTTSNIYDRSKGIHYRMFPENVRCLTAAAIDGCTLANNHVMDWGRNGLLETRQVLDNAGIGITGIGRNETEAKEPVVIPVPHKGRIIAFGAGSLTSGIPPEWAASHDNPGVYVIDEQNLECVGDIALRVSSIKKSGDLVLFSVHWGGNWGYSISKNQIHFARKLIDDADVDIVHGHSSHHIKGLEVYNKKLILYGTGDFINDYEGIGGLKQYRPDLVLMYLATIDGRNGHVIKLELIPLKIRKMKLENASEEDVLWIQSLLDRECRTERVRFLLSNRNTLEMECDV